MEGLQVKGELLGSLGPDMEVARPAGPGIRQLEGKINTVGTPSNPASNQYVPPGATWAWLHSAIAAVAARWPPSAVTAREGEGEGEE